MVIRRTLLSCWAYLTKRWATGQAVDLNVEASNRDVPHRRRLDLEFEDGGTPKVRFVQGITYWQVRFRSHSDMWFVFDLAVQDQLMHIHENSVAMCIPAELNP